jgi:hypothetical protein
VNIDSQTAAVKATQGALEVERRMLAEAFCGPPAPTSSPGTNRTMQLELAGGEIVFHKSFSGVEVANAIAFGQTDETPPLHEAVAWRLASALGPPWRELVAPCVLRDYAGEDGSLSLRVCSGTPTCSGRHAFCRPRAPRRSRIGPGGCSPRVRSCVPESSERLPYVPSDVVVS